MTEKHTINQTDLCLKKGDLTDMETGALVYYAQPDLTLGSGFGTAISLRGGRSIQEEIDKLDPIGTGEAVVTSAGSLKAGYIIHAVGPRFMEEEMEEKLRTTMSNVLKRAEEKKVSRILFPLMGTGFYGVPLDLSIRVMIESFQKHLGNETSLKEVVVCPLDSREYKAFQAALSALN